MYRMLPTALGIKQPREWIKVLPLVKATSSWELSQFSAATVYRGPTMWQILGCMCPNWFLNFLCETKLVVFLRKWPVLFWGRHSSLPTVYPAKVSAEAQSTWASCFSGYGVAPRATTIYLLTLSASHNRFWELLLSLWLHTPCFPQEGCMMKWHSIFSAGSCQAQHHHTEGAPQWLEGSHSEHVKNGDTGAGEERGSGSFSFCMWASLGPINSSTLYISLSCLNEVCSYSHHCAESIMPFCTEC